MGMVGTKVCRWCRSEVDARAKFCPKCGQVLRGVRTITAVLLFFLVLTLLMVLAVLVRFIAR
jgi:predicted nucleic acid-binding Zn ribbon protein